MNEHLPQTDDELERNLAIERLIRTHFPEDIDFILEELADQEDVVDFLYGQLLEIGQDPDEILQRLGITEETMTVIEVKPGTADEGLELREATNEI